MDYSDVSNTMREDIPLYSDEFPRWIIRPLIPEADIAAVPLVQRLSHMNDGEILTGSLALSAENFADPDMLIRGGTGSRVFGYPD